MLVVREMRLLTHGIHARAMFIDRQAVKAYAIW